MKDCVFCKIIKGELPADKVAETNTLLAFRDINPNAPTHILIVPKKHFASINEIGESEKEILGEAILMAKKIAKQLRIDQTGYRIVTNTGPDAGQIVEHLHFHLLGGKRLGRIG